MQQFCHDLKALHLQIVGKKLLFKTKAFYYMHAESQSYTGFIMLLLKILCI